MPENITRDKNMHFIMTKKSSHQEYIIIINVYTFNSRASKYIKQDLIEQEEK